MRDSFEFTLHSPLTKEDWDKISDEVKYIKRELLNKIRAEIEALPKTYPFVNHYDMYVKEDDVKKIIDRYKEEGSDKE